MIEENSDRDIISKDLIFSPTVNGLIGEISAPSNRVNQPKSLSIPYKNGNSLQHYEMMQQQLISEESMISQEIDQLLQEIHKLEDWANTSTDFKQTLDHAGIMAKLHFLKQEFLNV